MNRQALIELARVVENAPDKLFNMHTFEYEYNCGTARCAAGWAAVDPWFQHNMARLAASPAFPHTEALAAMFDISEEDANNLFGGDLSVYPYDRAGNLLRDVTKLEVIANIKKILEGKPTVPYAATQKA